MTKQFFQVPSTGTNDGLDIVFIGGPFDTSLADLLQERALFWSAEELAGLRISCGYSHPISTNGLWVRESIVYVPDTPDILIVKGEYNPLVRNSVQATQAHREGREVYLLSDDLDVLRERARADPRQARESGVYCLSRESVLREIPIGEFHAYGLTQFLFGDQARPYGEFLERYGIRNVPLVVGDADYTRDPKHDGKAFTRSLWARNLERQSGLNANDNHLHFDNGFIGGRISRTQ